MKKLLACAALAAAMASIPVRADVITFDDLSVAAGTYTPIANGYAGLNWNNFYVYNTQGLAPSGYVNGTVSGTNVAFNAGGNEAIVSSAAFVLNSAYFTAAWNDGMTIDVHGYLGGNSVGDAVFTINTQAPVLENFNWTVDDVTFTTSGGTNHGYSGVGTQFAMDNLTINSSVPEPAMAVPVTAMMALGLLAFRRKQAKATV
jgi:opacity protein-like surface antigen